MSPLLFDAFLRTLENDGLRKALRYRWAIFGVLSGGYVLVYFHRLCPAVLAVDMMQDLKTGGTLTGLLSAVAFHGSRMGQPEAPHIGRGEDFQMAVRAESALRPSADAATT